MSASRAFCFLGILLLSAGFIKSAKAATLTEGAHYIVGSQNGPTSDLDFNLSVNPANPGFAGAGNVGGSSVPVDETFNNPILDYAFYTDGGDDNTATIYASGGGGLVNPLDSLTFSSGFFGSPDWGNIWTTTDPGPTYATTPDRSNNTFLGNTTLVEGSVDISELSEGSLYFLYGGYRTSPRFDITMEGGSQIRTLSQVGDNDFSNNNEIYVYSVDFLNDDGSDTISYSFTNTANPADNGRFGGVVVTGVLIPEPSTGALLGLGGLGLFLRRRR